MKKAVLIALALAAGSGAQAQDRVRVVNEGGIRGDWTLAPGTQLSAPGYPGAFAKTGDDVCVAVGYRIQPDGSTSDFSLLKTWSSRSGEGEAVEGYWDAFSQAAVAALQQWKFAPRPEVGKPTSVDTVATMTFTGLQSVDAATLRGKCKIEDLAAFLEQVKVDMAKRSDLNRHQIENSYRQQTRSDMVRTPRN
ncbi:MAG TPA: hypothetical protein PKH66_04845 [Thermomonas sp.]|uniref:hypothetical protein n=1 Tax=Thermomonas sp. TaxID=1971895 RepID=UPI002B798586|nr:hypothetical protein [Thermomonas sp.]HPW12776.1 hypothetical protein [Thermomonas sp.]